MNMRFPAIIMALTLTVLLPTSRVQPQSNDSDSFDCTAIEKRIRAAGIESRQIIIVSASRMTSSKAVISSFEKKKEWKQILPDTKCVIGKQGFSEPDQKREGDMKTPSGIFSLKRGFGYSALNGMKIDYRITTDDDFWIDDSSSGQYNLWVHGNPSASSYERMRRNDNLYSHGIVIEYNTDPVVRGKGSAIFIHVWKNENSFTAGCVAADEKVILSLLKWIDRRKNPVIVMGTRSYINSLH